MDPEDAGGFSSTNYLKKTLSVIQIYGQQRSERYRKSGDAQVRRISAGVDRISAGVDRIGIDIGRLAAYLTAEEEAEEQEETR